VLGDLLKRAVNLVVLALAALAFFRVPLGGKTPAQHVAAILATPPAREAAASIGDAAKGLGDRVIKEIERARADAREARDDKPAPPPPK
jgi:hypothetical protein